MLIAYAEAGLFFDHLWVKTSHAHERAYCRMLAGKPHAHDRFDGWLFLLRLRPWTIRPGHWKDLYGHYEKA